MSCILKKFTLVYPHQAIDHACHECIIMCRTCCRQQTEVSSILSCAYLASISLTSNPLWKMPHVADSLRRGYYLPL